MFHELHQRARRALYGLQHGVFTTAEQREIATPRQSAGAFYPRGGLAGAGADLLAHETRAATDDPATMPVLYLFGQVLEFTGTPIEGALVEIWQPGPDGQHHADPAHEAAATGFSGYGSCHTGEDGAYWFRTLCPRASAARTAHIHARIALPDGRVLTTQIYLLDEPANDRDWIFQSLGPARQAAASIDPVVYPNGECEAGFNFVI